MEQDYKKFTPLVVLAFALAIFGVVQLLARRRKQPRSFREDPIGAIKDRGEIFAGRAQDATEDALMRLQESIDEIRGRLPEANRKRFDKRTAKRRKVLNQRLIDLNDQALSLVRDLRASSVFNRT